MALPVPLPRLALAPADLARGLERGADPFFLGVAAAMAGIPLRDSPYTSAHPAVFARGHAAQCAEPHVPPHALSLAAALVGILVCDILYTDVHPTARKRH